MDKKKLAVIVVVSLIVIGVGIALYYILKPDSGEDESKIDYDKGSGGDESKKDKDKSKDKSKDDSNTSTSSKMPLILQRVKDKLGAGGVYIPKNQVVKLSPIKGAKSTYSVLFYDNSRIHFRDNMNRIVLKGDYNDSGSTIVLQDGKRFENPSVYANIDNIIKYILEK